MGLRLQNVYQARDGILNEYSGCAAVRGILLAPRASLAVPCDVGGVFADDAVAIRQHLGGFRDGLRRKGRSLDHFQLNRRRADENAVLPKTECATADPYHSG